MLIILRGTILRIKKDKSTNAEAAYPTNSVDSIVVVKKSVSTQCTHGNMCKYYFNAIPNSSICSPLKGDGASIITSRPLLFLGKAI